MLLTTPNQGHMKASCRFKTMLERRRKACAVNRTNMSYLPAQKQAYGITKAIDI